MPAPFEVVRFAFRRFFEERAPETAASMAFYAVFSLFPLLLLLVVVGRFVVDRLGLQDDVLRLVLMGFPSAFADMIRRNLAAALGRPAPLSAVAGLHPGVPLSLLAFVALLLLYRLVPRAKVPWRSAVTGAAVATTGSLVATQAFTLFLESGIGAYDLVYGPLGALIAFLSWVYALALVVLFGAYLGASFGDRAGGGRGRPTASLAAAPPPTCSPAPGATQRVSRRSSSRPPTRRARSG